MLLFLCLDTCRGLRIQYSAKSKVGTVYDQIYCLNPSNVAPRALSAPALKIGTAVLRHSVKQKAQFLACYPFLVLLIL